MKQDFFHLSRHQLVFRSEAPTPLEPRKSGASKESCRGEEKVKGCSSEADYSMTLGKQSHLKKKQWLEWRETGRSPGGLSKEKGWCVVGDLSRSEETTMSPGGLFQVTTQKGALFTNPEVGGGAWLQTTKYEIGTILPKKSSPASLPHSSSSKDQLCHSN